MATDPAHSAPGNKEICVMNSYEEKQAARKAYYLDRAEKARQEATGAWARSSELAGFTMGAPILVGHHSEKRHRRVLETIRSGDRKAVMLSDKAEHYEAKAEAVGNGGISSIDPEALTKLRAELDEHSGSQQRMKDANRLVKRGDQVGLAALDLTEDERQHLARRGRFESYKLTNNGANIRRITGRIAELELIHAREEVCIENDLYSYSESDAVLFEFAGKPSEDIRGVLKRSGFKWSPMRCAWVRQLTGNGIEAGECVRKQLDRMLSEFGKDVEGVE
jgi:hypothetical protein